MAISRRKRLTIFLGSFIVTSILMVSIFWEGEWLPGNQVKRNILDNPTQRMQITEKAACQFKCLDLNVKDVRHFIRQGDVDLPPLEREPCLKYLIEYTDEKSGNSYEMIVRLCKVERPDTRDGELGTRIDEPVYLESVSRKGEECDCE